MSWLKISQILKARTILALAGGLRESKGGILLRCLVSILVVYCPMIVIIPGLEPKA